MEQIQDKIHIDDSKRSFIRNILIKLLMLGMVLLIWQVVAKYYHNDLLLPEPGKTIIAFFGCLADKEIMKNLLLTLRRVLNGFLYALIIGLPLGFLMGSFKLAEDTISGFIDSVRQVPIMAWVPLTIVWFGIGDGPTVFLIAFTGVFPIILNTIQGVHNISKDYYNAAKSMGAGPLSIFLHIVVPATIPDILTGARIAISTGWMSVI